MICFQVEDDIVADLDFGELNITSQEDDILDEDEALAGTGCLLNYGGVGYWRM